MAASLPPSIRAKAGQSPRYCSSGVSGSTRTLKSLYATTGITITHPAAPITNIVTRIGARILKTVSMDTPHLTTDSYV